MAGEPEPGVFGSLEPDPTEKKPGAGAAPKKTGAGASKNMPLLYLLYRLLEAKKSNFTKLYS